MPQFSELADLFDQLGTVIAEPLGADEALSAITAAGVQAIDGAEAAAVSRGRQGTFTTVAATSELPMLVDKIQYELGSGPCVDAALEDNVFRANDLLHDPRWPEFGHRAATETDVVGMLGIRLYFEDDDLIAGLNFYSTRPDAFDDLAETTGLVLSTHATLAMTGAERLERIANLERALESNRDIGVAVGIVMTRHLVTRQQGFDLLRVASQRTHRKIAKIAQDVIETGDLALPGGTGTPSASPAAGPAG